MQQDEINRRKSHPNTCLRYDSRSKKNYDFQAWIDSEDSSAGQVPGAPESSMERWQGLGEPNPNPNSEQYREYFMKDDWTYTDDNETYVNVMQEARPKITTAYHDVYTGTGVLRVGPAAGGSRLTKHRRKLSKRKRKRKRKPSKRRRRKYSKRRR